jgi:hypothetical protein
VKTEAPQGHARAAEKLQTELISRMTPGRRLKMAQGRYETAWQLKAAGLRWQYPAGISAPMILRSIRSAGGTPLISVIADA